MLQAMHKICLCHQNLHAGQQFNLAGPPGATVLHRQYESGRNPLTSPVPSMSTTRLYDTAATLHANRWPVTGPASGRLRQRLRQLQPVDLRGPESVPPCSSTTPAKPWRRQARLTTSRQTLPCIALQRFPRNARSWTALFSRSSFHLREVYRGILCTPCRPALGSFRLEGVVTLHTGS